MATRINLAPKRKRPFRVYHKFNYKLMKGFTVRKYRRRK